MADDELNPAEDAWVATGLILDNHHEPADGISVEYQQARIAADQIEATMRLVAAVDNLSRITGLCHGKGLSAESILEDSR